jgi:UDP-N-acetylmuramate--alanine ligase
MLKETVIRKEALFNKDEIRSVYFIGIGGIGMSALARYFRSRGARVSGYDKTPTPLTAKLEEEGIRVHYQDDPSLVDKEADIVVYTPAIPGDHRELCFYREHGFPVWKRSDMLGLIASGTYSICVAGTHGKTTTSTMVAHILRHSGFGCSAFLGGIAVNYDTNYWSDETNVTVAEADEYDRSFLKLHPDVAVLTSMDPDHLDIYGTESSMQEAFISFTHQIKKGGLLICHHSVKRSDEMNGSLRISYGEQADASVLNVSVKKGAYHFDVKIFDRIINGFSLQMGGRHNVENVLAAIVVADHLKIAEEKIRNAVASFKGVKRRFEQVYKDEDRVLIDDYAHHPEELKALISGTKELYPGKKCCIAFQPHLFSRTRDLAEGFASALELADEVLLMPIYPARELPIEGVDSGMIAERIAASQVSLVEKKDMAERLVASGAQVMLIAGAGDIDMLVETVREKLKQSQRHS